MRILGIDPGLARVGYGVIDVNPQQRRQPPVMVDCGIISTEPGSSDGQRMVEIAADLRQLCLLYTSPSPRDKRQSRMPSSA